MPVTPDAFLEAAKRIVQGGEEIDHRNATSRAYYAAYHVCREFAESMHRPQFADTGTHSALVRAFTNRTNNSYKSAGYLLEACRRQRMSADYEIETSLTASEARTVINQCDRIFEKVQSWPLVPFTSP